MTVGTRTKDTRVSSQTTLNGVGYGSTLKGEYRSKTWNGGDSVITTKPPPGKKRYYTVLDRRGKYVRKFFREKPLKRVFKKTPHPYTLNALVDVQPSITIVATALRWSDNAVLAQDVYGNVAATHFLSGGWPAKATPPAFDANDDIKLIGKLKEQIRGQDFNLGVFLGEGHQTLRLIGDSSLKLARAYRAFRQGRPADAVIHLTAHRNFSQTTKRSLTGNNWLELQYGWLPLLKDVEEGAKALGHLLSAPFVQRYSASIRKVTAPVIWDVGSRVIYKNAVGISRKRIVAMVSEPESIPQFLGLLDPELIAWELVPFSFVADWIAPIGPYLEARAFASRLKGTFVTTTTSRRKFSAPYGQDWNQGSYRWTYKLSSDSGTEYDSFSMSRTVSTTLAVPMPVFKPAERIASLAHCLNGLALLSTIVTGKKVTKLQEKLLGTPY